MLDGVDVCDSQDDHGPCIDLLFDSSDDPMFEGVVPFVGGAGLPKIFMAKEEPISSDDELDSIIVPMSEETPLDLAECKRGCASRSPRAALSHSRASGARASGARTSSGQRARSPSARNPFSSRAARRTGRPAAAHDRSRPRRARSRRLRPGYVGAYSPEERRERIARFHEKRLRRVWKKRVTYSTRKNIANKRMRVKGRFIKKEEESLMKTGLMTGALDAPCGEMLSSATASDVDDDVCNSSGAGGLSEDDDTPLSDALGCMLGDDAFS